MPAPTDEKELSQLRREDEAERFLGTHVGWVTGLDAEGNTLVDFEGNPEGPVRARQSVHLDRVSLEAAVVNRQGAVLIFERGLPSLPILIALIHTQSATPLVDAVLEQSLAAVPRQARVDGREVVIEAREEVVLRCGKASLTLRRDGQVLLRGVNIRTEADEQQRIKGGKVQIN